MDGTPVPGTSLGKSDQAFEFQRMNNAFVSGPSVEYRQGEVDDFPQLRVLLLAMVDEIGLFSVNEPKGREIILEALRNGRVFVAIVEGKIVGSVGFGITSVWYSVEPMLADYWTYVLPEYRNRARIGITLLKLLMRAADLLKMPLMVGVVGAKDTERKNKLYRKYFAPMGETFLRRT